MKLPLLLLARVAIVCCAVVTAGGAAPDRVLFDFEAGTFSDWNVVGLPPFGAAPVQPDRDMQPNHDATSRYRFSGWVGDFMVSQDIMLSKRRGIRETQVPSGRLISPPFLIDRDYLKFKLGGLLHPEVYVALVLEDSKQPEKEGETFSLARRTYANNKFDLVDRGWDVRDLRGRTARLHLVAQAGNRIIFRADHVVLSDRPIPEDVLYARTHWLDTTVMSPGKFHLMFPALTEAPAFRNASVVRGPDQRWHVFAEESKSNNGYHAHQNNLIYHASAADLRGEWSALTPVLARDVAGGEAWLREPVVVFDPAKNRFVMAYWGTGKSQTEGPFGICLATSPDGLNWTRDPRNPVFTHDFAPLPGSIVHADGQWIFFYSNHGDEAVHVDHAIIHYRTSPNLHDWSEARELAITSARGQSIGYSRPVFFRRGNEWFMLSNNRTSQQGRTRFIFTQVYSGPDLLQWNLDEQYRGNLNVFFGPQIFPDDNGEWQVVYWHVTSGGPWIARMRFDDDAPRVPMPTEWPGIPVAR
jgi:hypothetical protein